MKKNGVLSVIAALAMLLTVACSNANPDNSTQPDSIAATQTVTPTETETPTDTPEETPGEAEKETEKETEEAPPERLSMEELLAQMTLEEKIGQMTQAERQDVKNNDVKLFFLGSLLSGGGSAPATNTPEGCSKMIADYMQQSLDTRLGIPLIYGIDAVHGHNNVKDATLFPHNVGLGAIAAGDLQRGIDTNETIGRAVAQEMLATNIKWDFAPVLGIPEDVRWGRTYEGYGENVDLVTAMGTAFIRGLQGDSENPLIAACMKHYLGEGQIEGGRNQGNAIMTDEDIRNILPPYIEAIEAGALTLMPSFSSVNGVKMHQHKELLTDLLKGELGFEGFIISDWAAITQLTGGSYKMQIANAINAGVDMVMATNGRDSWVNFIKYMTELVNEGTIKIERIDDAVLRILKVKEKIGLFDNPLLSNGESVGTDENREIARGAAADSLVLLKNSNNIINELINFDSIMVAGGGANDIGMQCGGWSISWQGSHGFITKGTTILQGIENAIGEDKVFYSKNGNDTGDFDCVIAVIGENPYAETDGDRSGDILLRDEDKKMLESVYGLDCPVIVIMLSGRPMTISPELDNWDALVAAWLPGTEGAAVADVLFGERDFVGKTPYTWKVTQKGDEVLFPYGFGFSKR